MRFLADTHIILWSLFDHKKLSNKAISLLENTENVIYYSQVSLLEYQLKSMKYPGMFDRSVVQLANLCESVGFIFLDLKNQHIQEISNIEYLEEHKDPFDRLLIAQAGYEGMCFITHDEKILASSLAFVQGC